MTNIQSKYDHSAKGRARFSRQNERRRWRTKFGKVLKHIETLASLTTGFFTDQKPDLLFGIGNLRFTCSLDREEIYYELVH